MEDTIMNVVEEVAQEENVVENVAANGGFKNGVIGAVAVLAVLGAVAGGKKLYKVIKAKKQNAKTVSEEAAEDYETEEVEK